MTEMESWGTHGLPAPFWSAPIYGCSLFAKASRGATQDRRVHAFSDFRGWRDCCELRFCAGQGQIQILVSGQEAGKEEFDFGPSGGNWIAHGTAEVQTPQGAAHVTGTLELKPDGVPVRYEWSMTGAKKAASTIVFNGSVETWNFEWMARGRTPSSSRFNSDHIVVLDNNMYDQYAILARLYDWDKKGANIFGNRAAGNDAGNGDGRIDREAGQARRVARKNRRPRNRSVSRRPKTGSGGFSQRECRNRPRIASFSSRSSCGESPRQAQPRV